MTFEPSDTLVKARLEAEQRRAEGLANMRLAAEWLGMPLICPGRDCRRARRCLGQPSRATYGMPPCMKHYREEIRFLLFGPDEVMRRELERREAGGEAWEPTAFPYATVIERLYGNDPATLERLRRPKGVRGPGGWQNDPEGFYRYIEAGDWRDPHDVARRPPVSYYGRIVE